MQEFGLTQEDLARTLGRSRSALANRLRLLDLPEELKKALYEGKLTEGHAKALLGITDPSRRLETGQKAIQEKWTVRDMEVRVATWQETLGTRKTAKSVFRKNPDLRHLEEELQRNMGRKAQIKARGQKGWVRLAFYSSTDLDNLLAQLKGKKDGQRSTN